MTGPVEKFVTITPSRVSFSGSPDTEMSRIIRIIPEEKYPFKILSHKAREGKNITYTFEEIDGKGKAEYRLVVTNSKKTKGRYSDRIELKTDSKIQPEIFVYVSGYLHERPETKILTPNIRNRK